MLEEKKYIAWNIIMNSWLDYEWIAFSPKHITNLYAIFSGDKKNQLVRVFISVSLSLTANEEKEKVLSFENIYAFRI